MSNLEHAWREVLSHHGSPGGDHLSLRRFEQRLELNLLQLAEVVRAGTYRPGPVRQVEINAHGKLRELTILSVADRVLQRAALDVVGPTFERMFLDCSYGYRPHRSIYDAVTRLVTLREQGQRYVLKADIENCFPSIDHRVLLTMLSAHIIDSAVLGLFGRWVRIDASIRAARPHGLCLGGVISPLLCNLYLHPLDRTLRRHHLTSIRYADDLVVVSSDHPQTAFALQVIAKQLRALRLQLNMRKTQMTSFDEGFVFLGVDFAARSCAFETFGRRWTFEGPPDPLVHPIPEWYPT